jgi:geranylgeranyl reductase family protein
LAESVILYHFVLKPDYDADVIVAGAGPAGAAAACHIARYGASVIVLDRATFPRDKVCGDCVGPLAVVELSALGVSQMDGYAQTNIARRAALYLDGEELFSLFLPDMGMAQCGRVIPRLILDNLLVETAKQAGARVIEGFGLSGFSLDHDAVTVQATGLAGGLTLRSRLLIGADGSSSTVARVMRGSLPPRQDRMIAARSYFTNVEGPQDQLEVYVNSGCFPGYCWLFPTGNGEANVGLGVPLETLPSYEETPAVMLSRFLRHDPALVARLSNANMRGRIVGWPLMTYNHHLPIVSDRVMLVGDAAGLINPLNGEGIHYAFLSARWAAETVASHLNDRDFSAPALAPFATRVQRELGYDMALARLIVRYITNRALTPLWLQALKVITARAQCDAEYAHIMAGIFAGLTPARDALKLNIIGATLDQAAKTLAPKTLFDLAQTGFNLAYDATTNPSGFVDWIRCTATCAIELVSQATRDAVGGRPRI